MPTCRAAMTTNFLAASPDDHVPEILKKMRQLKIEFVPVVDGEGELLGIFSIQSLMRNLLPVSVAVSGGVQMDVRVAAAPGIAKRLARMDYLGVGEVMERKIIAAGPDMPLWEGINLLVQHGSPLAVVDPASGKIAGLIDFQSALDALVKLKDA